MDARGFLSDPSGWQFRQMTGRPLVLRKPTPEDETLINAETLGVNLVREARPMPWRFAQTPNVENDPRFPGFTRFRKADHAASSDQTVQALLDAAGEAYRTFDNLDIPAASAPTEKDVLGKFTDQKGAPVPWFLLHGFPRGYGQVQVPGRWVDALRRVLSVLRANRRPYVGQADPATTNPGYPTFTGGRMGRVGGPGKVVSALVVGPDPSPNVVMDRCAKFNSGTGLPDSASLAYGMGSRTGPAYKDIPVHKYVGDGTYEVSRIGKGWTERVRLVQMACAGANLLLNPLYSALDGARRVTHTLWHGGGPSLERFTRLEHQYSADISGFDAGVAPEVFDILATELREFFPDLSKEIVFWRHMESRPIVMPDFDLDTSHMAVIQGLGAISSGLKMTTLVGTVIELATTLMALADQGISVDRWPWSPFSDIWTAHLGDDVRIAIDRELDPEQWEQSFADVGLKCELLVDDVFLARHLSREIPNAPLAARIAQQTAFNEHARLGPDTLGITYLGYMARTEGAERLPPALQKMAWSIVSNCDWVKEYGKGVGIVDLRDKLSTDEVVAAEIARALKAAANVGWVESQMRDADHSYSAAQAVRIIGDVTPHSASEIASLRHLIYQIQLAAWRLPTQVQLEFAREGYTAVTESDDGGWAWLGRLAGRIGG